MNPLEKLKAKYGDLQNQIDTINAKAETEERDLATEDFTAIEALLDSQDAVKAQIKTAERMAESDAGDDDGPTAAEMGVVSKGLAAESEEYPLGSYMQDLVVSTQRMANGQPVLPRVANYQKQVIQAATATGANETVPADGGFLVGTDFAGPILSRVYDNSQVISRCTRRTVTAASNKISLQGIDESSRATGSRHGGIRSYWLSEANALTKSKPTFRSVDLELNKHGILFYATDELLADGPLLEQEVSQAVADELEFTTQEAIINGTGAGQPQGILGSNALVTQAKETGQAAKSIVYKNILNMMTRTWGPVSNYIWLHNKSIFPALGELNIAVGTGGSPVWLPPGGASASQFQTLIGLPLIEIEQASALGTIGDLMLVDLSNYIVAEKGGVQSAMSIHVKFIEGETVFRWLMRIDGQSRWHAPLTPFKGGSTQTQSPFVALATRS